MKYFLILLSILILASCIRTNTKQTESSDIPLNKDKTVTLPLTGDYRIICKLNEEFASDSCYDNLVVLKSEKPIYKAQDRKLFVISQSSKPMLYTAGQSDLILIQYDNRPDLNQTLAIHFQNGILKGLDTIPQIDNKPKDLDHDSFIEFYGTLHLTDAYCLDCDSAYYNPSLVYKFTEEGLKLDSINTIVINKMIWGDFYGYKEQKKILRFNNMTINELK
jgi:hypothetical protein